MVAVGNRPPPGHWGELVDGKVTYDLHEDQTVVLDHPARFKAAIAGTGGGKTAIGPLWILEQIAQVAETRDIRREPIAMIVLAPTYRMLARATAVEFCKVFALSPMRGKYKESKGYYELPNGWGKIWLLSADNPDRIEGSQFDAAWLDEAGQMKYAAWANIQNRLGLRYGPALLTTTPYEINWLKSKFCNFADKGNTEYFYHQWSSIDNPAYPMESYLSAKASMSEARFLMRYHGLFTSAMGLVYPDFESRVQVFTKEDMPDAKRLIGGIDWGYSPDPFAAVAGVVTEPIVKGAKDHLWLFFERYQKESISSENAVLIPNGTKYWADSSGGEEIEVFRRAGHRIRKNKVHSIIVGIDAVTKRLKRGTVTIHEGLINCRDEATEYAFPAEDDVPVGKNPKGRDHALDCVRYMIANHDRLQNAKEDKEWRENLLTAARAA